MVNLSKVTGLIQSSKKTNIPINIIPKMTPAVQKECDLNLLPSSYYIPSNLFQKAKDALKAFQEEFGEVKSSTYICEKIKQAKKANDDIAIDKLSGLRQEYSAKIKRLRREVFANKFSSQDEYIAALKKYLKENGTYMNCQECADLMRYNLRKQGLQADNVFMYTLNKENQRVSKAEHVFTIVNPEKTKDISSLDKCYIVDGWSGICMPYQKGIEFLKEFFGIDSEKYSLAFEIL